MSNRTLIVVELDASANREPFTLKTISLELDKPEFFKYGILQQEAPPKIKESDFDYLQSRVPSLEHLYTDYIEMTADAIINLCTDDTTKQYISELGGVAVGLKYSTLLLNVNLNKFSKIGVPVSGKYLDYAVNVDGKRYELETKGTIKKYYSGMVKDIVKKKKTASSAHLRFGTVTTLKTDTTTEATKCIVVDDPPEEKPAVDNAYFATQLAYYAAYLSFILDSKYYNKYMARIRNKRPGRGSINGAKFFGKYIFNGITYLGECFDYRLERENLNSVPRSDQTSRAAAFSFLTGKVGRTKIFIGLDVAVVAAINETNRNFLEQYRSRQVFEDGEQDYTFLDQDGILIIKSINGGNKQLENLFSEEIVEQRINYYNNFLRGIAHECGAPCSSPGIVGKPCAIHTFRERCHWHR